MLLPACRRPFARKSGLDRVPWSRPWPGSWGRRARLFAAAISTRRPDRPPGLLLTPLAWSSVARSALRRPFFRTSAAIARQFHRRRFEAVSGITTTGATVISDLDARLPACSSGGRCSNGWVASASSPPPSPSCPRSGSGACSCSGQSSSDRSEKAMPRVKQIATTLSLVYLGLTAVAFVVYWILGMGPFDALARLHVHRYRRVLDVRPIFRRLERERYPVVWRALHARGRGAVRSVCAVYRG